MTNDYGNLELHTVLLAAMKDIDRICRDHGLKYYLYAGTLLGAVNHKGFIPWDDDVDIVMFPEDFRVLAEIITKKYADLYEMRTFDNTPDWYSKMNKLSINGTTIYSQHDNHQVPMFIDICCLHSVPDKQYQRWLQRKKIELINLVLATQSGAVIPTSMKSKLTLGLLAKINRKFWGKCLDRVLTKYDHKDTECVAIMCNTLTCNPYTGRCGYETDTTRRAWHTAPLMVPFEDTAFMTISCYEDYLDWQYGPQWRTPYPEEKRITKHDVKSYFISEEVRKRVGL